MAKHDKVLKDVFHEPTKGNVAWIDIESLVKHNGGEMHEGAGSRVRFCLNGVRAVFHRPHPGKEAGKRTVESVRTFLTNAGVVPC
ncbi:MAG: type II toxin-antitoxin system HicA family toxin [Candidatus Nealsonbacteria bacterium]|nr:type II toxin-antitoxin system HicA family toxin [Candidatus Nealsonbacteria bacterium]